LTHRRSHATDVLVPQIDFDPNPDYYAELGVAPTASADEIKKAFRNLAKQYHPDSTGGDKAKEHKFKSISVAWDVLSDEKRRALYDQIRAGGIFPGGGIFGTPPSSAAEFLSMFEQIFRTPPIVEDRGHVPRTPRWHEPYRRSPPPPPPPPPSPPGTVRASDGTLLRADLLGFDVSSDVTITFDEAILGATVIVATIDGKAEVKIPPGSSSGRKLRLRGKGIYNPNGFTGDHHIIVQISVPEEISEETRVQLLKLVATMRRKPAEVK